MFDMVYLIYVSLSLLLLSAILPLVFIRSNEFFRKIFLSITLVGAMMLSAVFACFIYSKEDIVFVAYRLTDLFNVAVHIDRLSSFFVMLISLVTIGTVIYSFGYISHMVSQTRKNVVVSMLNFFVISMIFVVLSQNMFSFLAFWEIMALASFFLVMTDYDKEETRKAGTFYFIMTQLSTVFIMLGFILIYYFTGSLDIANAAGIPAYFASVIFISLFLGFGIKAGVIPLHKWLPYAHSAAPSNISSLMSGIMIKIAIYGIIRFALFVLEMQLWWGILILVFGIISALLGVIYALKEHDIKRLLAYHSIENIGIILIGIGLYIIFSLNNLSMIAELSLLAALFHTLNHAIFKALLFLSTGAVVNATGTRNIEEMGGLVKKMPYTASFFLIGAISISALPPFNGFVSELMIFIAFINGGMAHLMPGMSILLFLSLSLFALTSALAAACFVKAFGVTFLALPRSKNAEKAEEAPLSMILGQGFLAIISMALGVFSCQLFSSLGYALPIPNMLFITLFGIALLGLIALVVYFVSNPKSRISETWGCGIVSQNCSMEYTASGFSEPILTFFKPIYRTEKENKREFHDKHNSIVKGGHAEIHLMKVFEEYFYLPVACLVRNISGFLSKFHKSLDPDVYLFGMFIANIFLIILVWWFS